MESNLEIIAQLDKKIQQLPPQFLNELEDYVDFLLQKSQIMLSNTGQSQPQQSRRTAFIHRFIVDNIELPPRETLHER